MFKYSDYYRRYGIRRAMQMVAPPMFDIQRMGLPRESILHYLPAGANLGIDSADPLLQGVSGVVYEEHIAALTDKRGNPRSSMVSLNKLVRQYHRKYRKIRQLHDFDRMLADKRSTIVENYAMLPQLYRYPTNIYRPYSKWWNIQATFWNRVGEIASKSPRQQFLECRLPPILPSRAMLVKGSGRLTTRMLSLFPDHESLFILELWKWMAGYREESVIAKLSKETLDKVNLVWLESGKWFVVNLGLVESWRQPTADEIKAGAEERKGIPAIAIANRFLRMLMFLYEQRSVAGSEQPLSEGVAVEKDGDGHVEAKVVPAEVEVPIDQDDDGKVDLVVGKTKLDDFSIDEIEETEENSAKIDEIVAKDLEALDHLHMEREREMLEEEELAYEPTESGMEEPMLDIPALQDISLKEGVMRKADQLADMGLLSGAEYRRMEALSEAYSKLPDPYGSDATLDKAFTLHLDDLKIEPKKLATHLNGVVDETMLHTTLADFDAKYLKHCLRKDIGNAVLHMQKAGVAVTGYQVSEHFDAMNHYEAHAVQVTPVRGRQSTIHFRIPKVDENGTFTVQGVKYSLAKQRFDNPFRKVNSSTVALTSYYGKVFVSRSEKKVADYAGWICNQIAARGMDMADKSVTDLMLANIYDSNHRVPRIYSILGNRFRSFHLGELKLFFDYAIRDTLLPDVRLSTLETHGRVLVGTKSDNKTPIVVGTDNVFYAVEGKGQDSDLKVLGTLEELLDLDAAKAPKEVAEIKIGGKLLPVGIFLAYELGWENLLHVLGTQPVRTLQPGEHAKLGADEFIITFEDERYVFLKNSHKSGLVLQGLATWNDTLANYQMHLFNKKSIYLNILDRMKLGVRYLREMDLLVDMFVDPITKELLEKHNDPVTFVGLVLKACELLETDWSLDETDLENSRIRGYERFSGAVYGELVRAVRIQRSRGVANAPIEVHPNAVWNAITSDPSVRLVEESNPIHELKTQEEVTFAGTGGRSGRSMVGHTRLFHTNDVGVISEATKDSADVAITTYLTANPQLTDVRGETKRYKATDHNPTAVLSTSALLAPVSDRDD